MTITEIGALVGLATGIFTVIDRFVLGRPVITIAPSKSLRDLRFENASKQPVLLRQIRSWPSWISIAPDDTREGVIRAAMDQKFTAVLQPREARSFPIVVKRRGLLDPDSVAWAPFIILVS
jgi:hypothetical protein